MRLSKSKINTYLKCPLAFRFQYIEEIEGEPNEYMILGRDVHSVAETFADRFGDELEKVNIENELIKITNDLDIGYDISEHVDNLGSFFREVFIDNDYKLFTQEEYLIDEENRFSGICDIILEDENGDLVVIDYKTSNSNTFHKYRRELCYYKLLVENVYEKDVSRVGILFTRNGRLRLLDVCNEENKRKYLNENEISQAVDTLHRVRREIKNENFPAKRQFICRFCSYKHICGVY